MNFRSLVGCGLVLAAVAAQAADVVLTEDLVVTNQFVNPNADKPMPEIRTVTGVVKEGSTVTIQGANYLKVEPLYATGGKTDFKWPALFFHRTVGDGCVSYQAQFIDATSHNLKCLFLKFEQEGDDVKVSSMGDAYANFSETVQPGYRFQEPTMYRDYNLKDLVYRVMGGECYDHGEIVSVSELSDNYSGEFGVRISGQSSVERQLPGPLIYNNANASFLLIRNALYNEILPTGAQFYNSEKEMAFCHYRDYGTYASIQANVLDIQTLKCVHLAFQQVGADVLVTPAGISYQGSATKEPIDKRFTDYQDSSNVYGIQNLTYQIGRLGTASPAVAMTGANTYDGLTVVDNATLTIAGGSQVLPARDAEIPTKGVVVVTNGGRLVLSPQATINGNITIRAASKSKVTAKSNYPVSNGTIIELDDAGLAVENPEAGSARFNNLVLANGAYVTGNRYRVGNNTAAGGSLISQGDGSKTNEVEQAIHNDLSKQNQFTLQVDAPLLLRGFYFDVRSTIGGTNSTIVKKGSSVLLLRRNGDDPGEGKVGGGPLRMRVFLAEEGALRLLDDDCIHPRWTPLTLGSAATSATVSCAAGTTNAVKALNLEASGGTIEVESDATFTANALGDGWDAGESQLLVKYADKDTSSVVLPQLTASQRAHVRIQVADGKVRTVMQDESGRLIPAPSGLILIVR